MSLVFYDTETTGTGTFFDQILQFGAIQTDEDLNEIDRFEIRCRLLPHIVPAPGAMRVTRVSVSQLTDPSLPSHYEMIRAIRAKLLSWSPSLFVGWNSMKFDEDLIRQALYKTLHNPYLTNSSGNSRSDVMRIVQACSIYFPDALIFPTDPSGKRIFKLGAVAPANGFTHDRAHDALGDVEATIYICRLLIERAPHVWSSFMRFSTKVAVADYISNECMFCVSDFFYGKAFSSIVTTIGQNAQNGAEWYVYDLSIDPESLLPLSEEQLAERVTQSPKPVRRLKSNAAPMLFPAEDAPETCKGHGLEELERRAAKLQEDSALRQRLISALESIQEEYPPSPHVEKQIYDGFIKKPDELLMNEFHEAPWEQRKAIVERFQDPRLKTIGKQLIHVEHPHLLEPAICREHDRASAHRLLGRGEDVSWLTLPKALEEIEGMLNNVSGEEQQHLREHQQLLFVRHEQALRQAL